MIDNQNDPLEDWFPPSEAEFSEMIDDLVTERAPRVFALVIERSGYVDCEVAAWGAQFGDRTRLIDVHPDLNVPVNLPVRSPEAARSRFSIEPDFPARLVWADEAARSAE